MPLCSGEGGSLYRLGAVERKSSASSSVVCRHGPVAISAPTIEKKSVKVLEKKSLKQTKKPQQYNVFIINDPFNKREYVVKILLKVVPNMSFSRAYAVMDMAHQTGKGLVITTEMEMAEAYCVSFLDAGIFSTVEPAD